MFFSIFKIDSFPEYRIDYDEFFCLWNYNWWSTFWPKKKFMRIAYIGFKKFQKVVFVSLKNTKKSITFVAIDFLQISSWRYVFPENLTCTRLFFTKIYFLSMVFWYRLKSPLDLDWVVQKNSVFLFLSYYSCMINNIFMKYDK